MSNISNEITEKILNTRSIQPIAMHEFCDRYYIDIRIGMIYDMVDLVEITPTLINDELIVTLISKAGELVDMLLGNILIRQIYGYTNSKFRPKLNTFPYNTSTLVPRIHKLDEIDENRIMINDIIYYRWRDTEYYASDYGAIFSVPYGAFLRRNYNEKGYCLVGIRDNTEKRSFRVHRIVWESINGPIPRTKEIDHINDKRWDNTISNLQLLTHDQNLQKMNAANYSSLSDEMVIEIGKDLQAGISTKEVSEKYGISRDRVYNIKYRHFYEDILKSAGIDLSNVKHDRGSGLKSEDILNIIDMKNSGESATSIAEKYNISRVTVYNILKQFHSAA